MEFNGQAVVWIIIFPNFTGECWHDFVYCDVNPNISKGFAKELRKFALLDKVQPCNSEVFLLSITHSFLLSASLDITINVN